MTKNEQFDYAAKMAELETVLQDLQEGEAPLDEAIQLHERGKKLLTELEAYLDKAEVTIRNLEVQP